MRPSVPFGWVVMPLILLAALSDCFKLTELERTVIGGSPALPLLDLTLNFWPSTGSRGEFRLFSEKRHKEAMFGRKFDKKKTSSRARHYRIVGRGGGVPKLSKRTKLPTKAIPLPARRCMLLGKMDNTGAYQRSHSGVRTKRTQKLNLHWKKVFHPGKGYFIRLRLSMRGLKTIKRLGLVEAAKRFNLDIDDSKLFCGYPKSISTTPTSTATTISSNLETAE